MSLKKTIQLHVILCCLFLMVGVAAALADEPMNTIRQNIDKVLVVLKNPAYQAESAVTEKKAAIRDVSNAMFDWTRLSQMTLGKNWADLTPDQQKEFVSLFKEILETAYIDKILSYKNETIEYVSCQSLSDTKAEVATRVVSDPPVSITYRMVNADGKWGVYDVIVEGVSLAQNYRTQFRDILAKQTPADLIATMRKKVG